MPSARTEVAVAEVGGKIYVAGGFGGERELEIYDPAADRWSRGTPIPREVHHAGLVGLSGKLYLVGGYVGGWTPTDEVHEYDPAGNRWRALAPLPTPRGALAAAVLGGKIYAVGGVGFPGRNTPAHEALRPRDQSWTKLAPVPTRRDHHAAAALDGRLYVIGGRVDGSYARNLATNEAYDPGDRSLGAAGAAADRPQRHRRGHPRWADRHRGGEAPSGTFNQVEAYDPGGNSWSAYARMPTARHGLGAAVSAGACM